MKKLILLSMFFYLLTFSTSHALSIVTENCNISPLNSHQLQKIDVYRSTVLMSYGKISYGKNKVAFYSANFKPKTNYTSVHDRQHHAGTFSYQSFQTSGW